MKPETNIVLISATGGHLKTAVRGFRQFDEKNPGRLEFVCRTSLDIDENRVEEFIETHIRRADYLFFILHGGRSSFPPFDRIIQECGDAFVYIHPSEGEEEDLSKNYSTEFGGAFFKSALQVIEYDGAENWMKLFSAAVERVENGSFAPIRITRTPTEGIYHPRLGTFASLEEYLGRMDADAEEHLREVKPVIGITFYRGELAEENLLHIDALIEEIENQDALPVPCFSVRFPDQYLNPPGNKEVFERFFFLKGKRFIHVLLNLHGFSMRQATPDEADAYQFLDVTVLQSITLYVDYEFWSGTEQGLTPIDVTVSGAQPELDGTLITLPIATYERREADPDTGATLHACTPLNERIEKLVGLAKNWARLRMKKNRDKRVAIIFHNYPPRNDQIGTAAGLDSFESVAALVRRFKSEGYTVDRVYNGREELSEAVLASFTNDKRWITPEMMEERVCEAVGEEQYRQWTGEFPEAVRRHMKQELGEPPGESFVYRNKVVLGGIKNGNLFIGIQPPRGSLDQPEKIHDPHLPPTYHYIYFYRWLRRVFRADAVIHVGKHGSLEWLPGKTMALSEECYPDLAILDLPNIYPYIINDPSEGTQAKRRSYACVDDHMIPVMTNAETYEELAEVDTKLIEYIRLELTDPERTERMKRDIWETAVRSNLHTDIEISEEKAFEDFDAFVHTLHSYVSEVSDTAVSSGLHILGRPPEGERLTELLSQLLRLRNGNIPSLHETIARYRGYNYDFLMKNRSGVDRTGKYATNACALEAVREESKKIVGEFLVSGTLPHEEIPGLESIFDYVKNRVLPNIMKIDDEEDAVFRALQGRHILPGESGSPTRGMADILPTGRNFFSVDPFKIPGESAWKAGVALGDALVETYRRDTGSPPESVALVVWAGNTMRTLGEDVAEALYLMGVRPVWNSRNGRVEGIEIIPTGELKFPRIDITFRTSGLFRDTFPNLMELLDEAVLTVAALDEPSAINTIRKNVQREKEELVLQGLDPDTAEREASLRVFSDPPGGYGTGVPEMIEAKQWKKTEDLGNMFIGWSGYAYGRGVYGTERKETFARRLSDIDLVVKNEDSREYDMLSCTDFNAYHGGLVAAVKASAGSFPDAYSGDSSDPDRVIYRSIRKESKHIFRSRILNPKWIKGLMEHGYKGAADLSAAADTVFHWDATSEVIEDWMYDGIADRYPFNEEMKNWFKEVNPYALRNIVEKLLEAAARGMWNPSEERKGRLDEMYMEIEGDIEEALE
jgi:cobaltochelatase CobN